MKHFLELMFLCRTHFTHKLRKPTKTFKVFWAQKILKIFLGFTNPSISSGQDFLNIFIGSNFNVTCLHTKILMIYSKYIFQDTYLFVTF